MTPPDQPEEQPSALSRLERALAGFGDPARPTPDAERAPEADPEPEVEAAAPEVEATEPEPEPEADPLDVAEDEDEDEDVEEWPAQAEASSVLDIASAVEAIERLSAAEEVEAAEQDEAAESESAIAALERQWAQEDQAAVADDADVDEPPRFVPADLRSRIKEFEEEDEPAAVDEERGEGEPVEEELEPLEELPPPRDAASSWERNLGDASLPYFLVEDNRAIVAEPVSSVPTVDDLRQQVIALPVKEEEHTPSVARTLAEIPILLIVAALIAFLVKTFLAQAYYIPSGSMLPQLKIDDRVVVSKLAYKAHDPRRGDIVVFDDPRSSAPDKDDEGFIRKIGEGIGIVQPSTDEFIKRVIGLPGDTVEGRDGHVFINGHRLYEPYLTDSVVTSDFAETKVKTGHLWVMGDNRSGSADSRVFGQIDVDTIVGRAVVTVWPFGNVEFL